MKTLKKSVPILGLAAFSGTGKTSLLEKIIPILKQKGLRLALIKHSHHDFEIDQRGKDSHRLRRAGAEQLVLASPYRSVLFQEHIEPKEPNLADLINIIEVDAIDLILVEGFRDEAIPKLELHRPSLGKPLLYPQDPHIIAIASDEPLTVPDRLKFLDLNQTEQIADWIEQCFV